MIDLYTWTTPNGWKASIALEELGLAYEVHPTDIGAGDQHTEAYKALNPNGRIPVIHDRQTGQTVFESGAILLYLAEKTGRLLGETTADRWQAIQWTFFQMAGIGPMFGQATVFSRYAPEKLPWAIERYRKEGRRLLEVLDGQLANHRYIAGEHYTIADIATFPWTHHAWYSGIDASGLEHLARWDAEIAARPAVQRGLQVPHPMNATPDNADEVAAVGKTLV